MLIIDLVERLGVQWPPLERERRLFAICARVQGELWRRAPGTYRTASVAAVPEAWVEDALAILRRVLAEDRGLATRATGH